MLAYAAHRRPAGNLHPKTLALIVGGHALALGAVMTARGDIPIPAAFDPTEVTFIDPVVPPPPPPPEPARPTESSPSRVDTPVVLVPIPSPAPMPTLDLGPPLLNPGSGTVETAPPTPVPVPIPAPPAAIVRVAAKAMTAASDLTPPYPDEKRRMGEEAVLRLSLAIDARGRVTSVVPAGTVDPAFLEAARKHILKRWKYRPATEDGVAVASRQTVTIRFRIDR